MYILTALTGDCEHFIKEQVASDMRQGNGIIIEFNRVQEAIAALKAAGFEPGRDFSLIP